MEHLLSVAEAQALCLEWQNEKRDKEKRLSAGVQAGKKACGCISYLKPQPVPPRTMAAIRMAPAMEPMIRLVALGPAEVAEGRVRDIGGGGGRGRRHHMSAKDPLKSWGSTYQRR